jgi:hypothetical protein
MRRGILYRLRMRHAESVRERARRAERRSLVETGAYGKMFRDMSVRLNKRAHRIEARARDGRIPW